MRLYRVLCTGNLSSDTTKWHVVNSIYLCDHAYQFEMMKTRLK